MKLYFIVASERATKGQGGNKQISGTITVEHDNRDRENMGTVYIRREGDEYVLRYLQEGGNRPQDIDRILIRKR